MRLKSAILRKEPTRVRCGKGTRPLEKVIDDCELEAVAFGVLVRGTMVPEQLVPWHHFQSVETERGPLEPEKAPLPPGKKGGAR